MDYSWLFIGAHSRPAAAVFSAPSSAAADAAATTTAERAAMEGSPPLTARTVHARLRCTATLAAARVFKQRLVRNCRTSSAHSLLPKAVNGFSRNVGCEVGTGIFGKVPSKIKFAPVHARQEAFRICYAELMRLTRRVARRACRSLPAATPSLTAHNTPAAGSLPESPAAILGTAGERHGAAAATAATTSKQEAALKSRKLLKELRLFAIKIEQDNPETWPRAARQRPR